MLLNALQQVVKPGTTFSKLRQGHEPYLFHDWAADYNSFRYSVKHKGGVSRKRVMIQEIRSLLEQAQKTGQPITRKQFEHYCSTTLSDGPCGFAVIAGVLSTLKIGQYEGSKTGIRINDRTRLAKLLELTGNNDVPG